MILKDNRKMIISQNILREMAAECSKCDEEREQILQNLEEYLDKHESEISHAIWIARKGLLKISGTLKDVEKDNLQALKDAAKIQKIAVKLRTMLPDIGNLDDISELSQTALVRILQIHIGEIDVKSIEFGREEPEKRLEAWNDFLALLDYHIMVFEEIRASLLLVKNKPVLVGMLAGYIEQIAKMYMTSTKWKFTLNEHGDYDALPEGVRFVKKSMAALNRSDDEFYEKYPHDINCCGYTDENFENACRYARDSLRKQNLLGKYKKKRG